MYVSLLVLITVVVILWLDEIPLFLALNGNFEGSVVVAATVVANGGVPPELVDTKGDTNDVGVVQFVVVADPGADHSPEGLVLWVGTDSSFLWCFTAYIPKNNNSQSTGSDLIGARGSQIEEPQSGIKDWGNLPSGGRDHMCFGARRIVEGVKDFSTRLLNKWGIL